MVAIAVLALVATAILVVGGSLADAISSRAFLEVTPVPLDRADPKQRTVGRLVYRGGLDISFTDNRFGGLSSLIVVARGRSFLATSDRGFWVRGNLQYTTAGDLAGIAGLDVNAMQGPGQQWLTTMPWRDAESLAPIGGDSVVVGFEDAHRLWRYDSTTGEPQRVPPPRRIYRAPRNAGVEALASLPDNRLVAFSEGLATANGFEAWVQRTPGASLWEAFSYRPASGYKPTGAATLPDGNLVLVERRFPPFAARIVRIRSEDIVPGAVVAGEELAVLAGSITVDNFEGIDAVLGPDGETLIYLVTDDNYSVLQKTLLMVFELVETP